MECCSSRARMKILVAGERKTKADAKADFVMRGSFRSSDPRSRDMTRFTNFDVINFDLESGCVSGFAYLINIKI